MAQSKDFEGVLPKEELEFSILSVPWKKKRTKQPSTSNSGFTGKVSL